MSLKQTPICSRAKPGTEENYLCMKAILIILVVALGGLTYKFQLDAKSAKAKMVAAEDAAHEAETLAEETESDLEKATLKIEQLEKSVATYLSEIDTMKRAQITAVVETPLNAASSTPKKEVIEPAVVESKFAELRRIYDTNVAEIARKRGIVNTNLKAAQASYEALKAAGPKFVEHTKRVNDDETTSTVGVRMSEADRKEVLEKHKEELQRALANVTACQAAFTSLDAESIALEQSYEAAQKKLAADLDK